MKKAEIVNSDRWPCLPREGNLSTVDASLLTVERARYRHGASMGTVHARLSSPPGESRGSAVTPL